MSKNILIIDDDRDLLEVMGLHFDGEGYNIIEGENGVEALILLDQEKIDLIICDIRMPDMDGITFLKKVRNDLKLEVPFFLISGFSDISEEEATKLGAQRLLNKSTSTELLIQYVKDTLS